MTETFETRKFKNDFGVTLELPVLAQVNVHWHLQVDEHRGRVALGLYRETTRGFVHIENSHFPYINIEDMPAQVLIHAQRLLQKYEPHIGKPETKKFDGFYK